MRTFQVGCTLTYDVQEESAFIFNVMPVRSGTQLVAEERLSVTPHFPIEEHVEPGTGNRYHRLCCPGPTQMSVQVTATVHSVTPPREPGDGPTAALPSDVSLDMLRYLFPSRYCQPEQLEQFAQQEFSRYPRGLAQVDAICAWIGDNIAYELGSTGPATTAFDVLSSRMGVCRDFTHLAVSFCRALAIPARFVSGYAVGLNPPDFHALLEVWVGDRWYLFDATARALPEQFVRIGSGRDAAEVSFAFIFGNAGMTNMSVQCVEDVP